MRKLVYLIALAMLTTLIVAPAAVAQDATCEQVLDRVYAGDSYLTSAELLSCGISPEAIGAGPSINGPYGVGTTNVCSGLPQGSPESVACFEELIAYMGYYQPQLQTLPSTGRAPSGRDGDRADQL